MKKMISAMALGICSLTTFAQQVSINCPEGNNWQKEKRAVVSPSWPGGVAFSGVLLNGGNGKVYLYSVLHAFYNQTLDQEFYIDLIYNYEQTGCNTGAYPANYQTVSTKVKVVSRPTTQGSDDFTTGDYSLMEVLNPLTAIPANANVYLAGWDHSATSSMPTGSIIHHPNYLPKMISSYVAYGKDTPSSQLKVKLAATTTAFQGITFGSSGAPAFNQDHRVIGTLDIAYAGSNAMPQGYYDDLGIDWIALQWNNSNPARNLKGALDPYNTGLQFVNGMEWSELKRIMTGAKYLVNKNSGYAIGNGGCYCDVLQSTAPLNTEYTFGCIGCTPYPDDHSRSVNRFYIQTDEQGYYKFTHQMAEENLAIANGALNDGASLKTNAPFNGINDGLQRFRILPTGDGDNSYYIQNVNSGKYLDVEGASVANGAKVIQWTFNGYNNQKWYIRNSDGSNNLMAGKANLAQPEEAQPSISLYPVPVTDVLNIALGNNTPEPKSVSVINAQGASVLQKTNLTVSGYRTLTLDVQDMPAGLYYVQVIYENGRKSSAKFIKK